MKRINPQKVVAYVSLGLTILEVAERVWVYQSRIKEIAAKRNRPIGFAPVAKKQAPRIPRPWESHTTPIREIWDHDERTSR